MNSNPFTPPITQLETFTENNSGMGSEIIPDGVKGWSWGGFLLTIIWGLSHRVWLSLLIFIPYIGLLVSIYIGIKGRELAWKNKRWESVEHFNRVQRSWSIWSAIIAIVLSGIIASIAIPSYQAYTANY